MVQIYTFPGIKQRKSVIFATVMGIYRTIGKEEYQDLE